MSQSPQLGPHGLWLLDNLYNGRWSAQQQDHAQHLAYIFGDFITYLTRDPQDSTHKIPLSMPAYGLLELIEEGNARMARVGERLKNIDFDHLVELMDILSEQLVSKGFPSLSKIERKTTEGTSLRKEFSTQLMADEGKLLNKFAQPLPSPTLGQRNPATLGGNSGAPNPTRDSINPKDGAPIHVEPSTNLRAPNLNNRPTRFASPEPKKRARSDNPEKREITPTTKKHSQHMPPRFNSIFNISPATHNPETQPPAATQSNPSQTLPNHLPILGEMDHLCSLFQKLSVHYETQIPSAKTSDNSSDYSSPLPMK